MEIKKHPKCDGNSRRKLCSLQCDLCFSRSYASTDNAYMWHESNVVTARDVFKRSEKEYNFFCEICNHLFVSMPRNMSKSGCPFCSTPPKRICDKEDCMKCFEKTIASEELKDKWSENNEVTPRQVFKGTHDKYKFICSNEDCGHEYEKCFSKKTGCPYCCKGGRKLCGAGAGACKICYKTSFALSHRAKFWSPKNEGNPCDYTMSTSKKFLFDCPDCGHEFSTALSKITYYNRWCPYCAVPSKKFCGAEACKFCSKRTFATLADPEKLKRYSNKNPKRPNQMFAFSHEKCIFECPKHGEFTNQLYGIMAGQWCPLCVRKTEAKLLQWLEEKYPGDVKREAKFDWCKNRKTQRHLPFDFCIKSQKLLIELDGAQHFRQVHNWAPPEQTQIRDRYKERKANENGYSIIRLLQEEVLYDKTSGGASSNWQVLLERSIERMMTDDVVEQPEIVIVENRREVIVNYDFVLVYGPPVNYDFGRLWDIEIVPHLDNPKIKKAIADGVNGFLERERDRPISPAVKGRKYDPVNNPCPASYTSSDAYAMRIDREEETLLEDLRSKNALPKSFLILEKEFQSSDDDDDEITERYLKAKDEIMHPFIYDWNVRKYKLVSYILSHACHWWAPTFELTLARLVCPEENWMIQEGTKHTTVINRDYTKVFDLLYWAGTNNRFEKYVNHGDYEKDGNIKEDFTLGGKDAYEDSSD